MFAFDSATIAVVIYNVLKQRFCCFIRQALGFSSADTLLDPIATPTTHNQQLQIVY